MYHNEICFMEGVFFVLQNKVNECTLSLLVYFSKDIRFIIN